MTRPRELVLPALVLAATVTFSAAEPFRLAVANSFAAMNTIPSPNASNAGVKKAYMAVRGEGCADPSTVRITATAERIAAGVRRSEPMVVLPVSPPGAFSVMPPPAGTSLIAFVGTCGQTTASALVPITTAGFDRDGSTFYPRAPTAAEIDAVLRKQPVKP
jgi:hypothetical protein